VDSTHVLTTVHPRTDLEGWGNAAILGPPYTAAFYPAIRQLNENSIRNVRISSLYAGPGYAESLGIFNPAQLSWQIQTVVTRDVRLYQRDTNRDHAWIFENLPVVVEFDPALQPWTIPADRMAHASGQWRQETNPDVSWMASVSPISGWTAPMERLPHALGRWTPETNLDNAWLFSVQPVAFDGALFPGIAELVGARTPMGPRLAVVYYLSLVDLSWVHDVIPLTDPLPGPTFIPLRPIAPIMSARRRNKRRR
jgi:hypothetical protein